MTRFPKTTLSVLLAGLCPHGSLMCPVNAVPSLPPAPAPVRTTFYAAEIDQLKTRLAQATPDSPLRKQADLIIAEARNILALPLVARATTLDELKNPVNKRPGAIDARTWIIKKIDPAKAQDFALASADVSAAETLARELPLLAAAYRLTRDTALLERLRAQLAEFASWNPIQRPGWTLYNGTNDLPPDRNDGVWLATGHGLAALCQTLDILPPSALTLELHAAIRAQLDREINRTLADWNATPKRAWYMRSKNVTTNQWIVPFAGLALAAATDLEKHHDAYELAITNLTMTLDALGPEGASSEGATYAMHRSAPVLYLAAIGTRATGDERIASHPFLQNFPTWLSQIFQPGQNTINAFDCWGALRGMYHTFTPNITLLATLSRSPHLAWILRNQIKTTSRDLNGLLSLNIPDTLPQPPPLWGAYDRARWAVWRSSWTDDASGVWIRGEHPADFHAHNDHGHVNYIVRGKPLLIEAGTPGYDHALKADRYDSVVGHNVLQVGDEIFPKKSRNVPLLVARLDATGGDATVRGAPGYANVRVWDRRVHWDSDTLTVTDDVELKTPDTVLFRWHLASKQPLAIAPANASASTRITVALPAGEIIYNGWNGPLPEGDFWTPPAKDIFQTPPAAIAIEADQPVVAAQEEGYDHTLKFRIQNNTHTLLTVRSAAPISKLKITTTFTSQATANNVR
ncbi:Heparinase II/III-like protein [Opitutaceae bacterium TAV1]|nr:Heparinase II/III-like protein [Opitutaceae bacterium TAV1]